MSVDLAGVQNITASTTEVRNDEHDSSPCASSSKIEGFSSQCSHWQGKAGLSETVLEEIRQQLQSRVLVKIKVNKGLFEREQRSEVWNHLAENTGSILVLQRGNIGVLWRR